MKQYLDLVKHVFDNGEVLTDRTGVGTISCISPPSMRFDLGKGFPIVTTKQVNFNSVSSELLWFLEGSTDERRLAELRYKKPREECIGKNTIWTANVKKQGVEKGFRVDDMVADCGKLYGNQFRSWSGKDQLKSVIDNIKKDPYSRRHVLSLWNYPELENAVLYPCHMLIQFFVRNGKLSGKLFQRSADVLLGVPYNIASYALLIHIIAKECGLGVGEYIHDIGDAHIYLNHVEQMKEQLTRNPHKLPKLHINDEFELFQNGPYKMDAIDNFCLENYTHEPAIKGSMAV